MFTARQLAAESGYALNTVRIWVTDEELFRPIGLAPSRGGGRPAVLYELEDPRAAQRSVYLERFGLLESAAAALRGIPSEESSREDQIEFALETAQQFRVEVAGDETELCSAAAALTAFAELLRLRLRLVGAKARVASLSRSASAIADVSERWVDVRGGLLRMLFEVSVQSEAGPPVAVLTRGEFEDHKVLGDVSVHTLEHGLQLSAPAWSDPLVAQHAVAGVIINFRADERPEIASCLEQLRDWRVPKMVWAPLDGLIVRETGSRGVLFLPRDEGFGSAMRGLKALLDDRTPLSDDDLMAAVVPAYASRALWPEASQRSTKRRGGRRPVLRSASLSREGSSAASRA